MPLNFDDLISETKETTATIEPTRKTSNRVSFDDLIPSTSSESISAKPIKRTTGRVDFSDLIPKPTVSLKPEETLPTGWTKTAKETLKGIGTELKEHPFKTVGRGAMDVLKVARWPFWRTIEHPVSTIGTEIQEGKFGLGTLARAGESYIPFKKVEYPKMYSDVYQNYYKSITGEDAPAWASTLFSIGVATGIEPPLIRLEKAGIKAGAKIPIRAKLVKEIEDIGKSKGYIPKEADITKVKLTSVMSNEELSNLKTGLEKAPSKLTPTQYQPKPTLKLPAPPEPTATIPPVTSKIMPQVKPMQEIPIKETALPLEKRVGLLERAGHKEAAEKLRQSEQIKLTPVPKSIKTEIIEGSLTNIPSNIKEAIQVRAGTLSDEIEFMPKGMRGAVEGPEGERINISTKSGISKDLQDIARASGKNYSEIQNTLNQIESDDPQTALAKRIKSKIIDDVVKGYGTIDGHLPGDENIKKILDASEQSIKIPETYNVNTPERISLRNQIINRNYIPGAYRKEKIADIVLGLPASGKNTYIAEPLAKDRGSILIDSDIYKKQLPEYNKGIGAPAVHRESSNIIEAEVFKRAIASGDNIVLPRLGKNINTIRDIIKSLNNNGYKVNVHYIDLPADKAVERAVNRYLGGGNYIDPRIIKSLELTLPKNYDIIKMEKGVSSYGKWTTDVAKGEMARLVESSPEYVRLRPGRSEYPKPSEYRGGISLKEETGTGKEVIPPAIQPKVTAVPIKPTETVQKPLQIPSAGFLSFGKGVHEIDKIQIEPEPKDLVGWKGFIKSYFAPVRHVIGDNPIANNIARMGRDTVSNLTAEQAHYSERIDNAFKGLTPEEKVTVIDYLESKKPIFFMPEKIKKAYNEADLIRNEMLQESQAIGKDIAKWKIPPEQYWPHIFIGQYQILDGQKTIEGGFARDLNGALVKAQLYLRDNPTADIKIIPKNIGDEYTATLLSRKGFFRFINEVKKATELDKDEIMGLMKGVAAIKPRGKFVGNWKQRSVNLGGYLKDPIALKIYVNRILRKKWLDPFTRQATDMASQLPSALRDYMLEYVEAIRGKYNPMDNKFQISRSTAWLTGIQSKLKLGYRPISALVNRLQPYQTAYGEIGNYLLRGSKWKSTPEGKGVLEESGVYGQIPKYYTGEFLATPKTPMWKPLGMFSKAEMANREDVIAGGYLFAKNIFNMLPEKVSKMGYSYVYDYLTEFKNPHKAALEYAKDLNADTNYIYDVSDLPKVFRTPFLKPALQFKTYPVNFVSQSIKWLSETVRNPSPHNIARAVRFTGANLLLGGVRSIPYAGKYLWRWMILTPLLGFLNPKVRDKFARGIFSWLGIDLSQRLGPNEFLPRNTKDLLGPTAGDLYNLYKYLQGQQTLWQTVTSFSGAIRDIYEAIRSGSNIEDPNRRWRMIAEATGWEKLMQAIGTPLVKETLNRDMQNLITDMTEQYKNKKAHYVDMIIEYRDSGKPIGDILKQANSEGIFISFDDLMGEARKKRMPALQRRVKTMPKPLRRDILDLAGKFK